MHILPQYVTEDQAEAAVRAWRRYREDPDGWTGIVLWFGKDAMPADFVPVRGETPDPRKACGKLSFSSDRGIPEMHWDWQDPKEREGCALGLFNLTDVSIDEEPDHVYLRVKGTPALDPASGRASHSIRVLDPVRHRPRGPYDREPGRKRLVQTSLGAFA